MYKLAWLLIVSRICEQRAQLPILHTTLLKSHFKKSDWWLSLSGFL